MIYIYNNLGQIEGEFKTQKEVSNKLNCSVAAVSKAMSGKIKTVNNYIISAEDFITHVSKYNIPAIFKVWSIKSALTGETILTTQTLPIAAKTIGVSYLEFINIVLTNKLHKGMYASIDNTTISNYETFNQ